MAIDTRTAGTYYKPYYDYKNWYTWQGEPTSWTGRKYGSFNLGGVRAITSERDRRKNSVWIKRVHYRRKKDKKYVIRDVYRALTGPRRRPNPFRHYVKHSLDTGQHTRFRVNYYGATSWLEVDGQIASWFNTFPSMPVTNTTFQKAADSNLFQEASKATFDAYLQAGEMLETLAMLRSPLAALREASEVIWHKMHKHKYSMLKKEDLTQAISGSWLEYSFGISPLMNGTAEIMSSLVDALNPIPTRYKQAKAYVFREEDSGEQLKVGILHGVTSPKVEYYQRDITQHQINSGMWLANDANSLSMMSQLGLNSMRAIVGQAWALLPLSFAIDWFVGIGPLLDECRPVNGRILSSYRTYTKLTERTTTLKAAYDIYSPLKRVPLIGQAKSSIYDVERVVDVTRPGTIQMGPGLFSLSQGMSLAALSAAPITKLWRKLPWH